MSLRTIATILTLSTLVLAGCINPGAGDEGEDDGFSPMVGSAGTGGAMTATETKEEWTGLCTDRPGMGGGAGAFCAERKVIVNGVLTGFSAMDVDLSTFNGDVTVTSTSDDDYGFVASLRARGATEADAKRAMEEITFAWSHADGDAHFLSVEASYNGKDNQNARSAILEARLPKALLLRLTAETINGDVSAKGLRAEGLHLESVNGDVIAEAEVAQVQLDTVNGDVEGTLKPLGSGRIRADTTNGEITLRMQEGDAIGYDVLGRTTNGEVEIGLRDGDVGPCPQGSEYYTPPCNQRTFKTRNYDARQMRLAVTLESVNGDVTVNAS